MKKINLNNWKYNEELENVLFAVQRLDEILFFYTQDTYKASIYNTKTLIDEYLEVRDYIEDGLLYDKNDEPVLEELMWSLGRDKEAQKVIGKEFVNYLIKNKGSLNNKEKVKFFRLIQSRLEGNKYFDEIKETLKRSVRTEKKKEIDRVLLQFVCEAKNQGYNIKYIYGCLNKVFFTKEVNSIESIDEFIDCFNCKSQKYVVYVEVNEEIGDICVRLTHVLKNIEVELLQKGSIPSSISISNPDRKLLKFKYIDALDNYAALEIVRGIVKNMGQFYAFYRHNIEMEVSAGYTTVDEQKYDYICPEVTGIKKSAKIYSRQKSTIETTDLFDIARSSRLNFYFLSRIMEIHNIAFEMNSPSNSLLDLWSILELLLEKDYKSDRKNRVMQIVDMLEPFIKGAYIEQIVVNLMNDIRRWDKKKYKEIIDKIDKGDSELEKIFAFVSLNEYDILRKDVYKCLNEHPLLRYRIFCLNENFKTSKNLKKLLMAHEKKTTWHIQRIYRARNCIIHDGENVLHIHSLVENLHSYIDILANGIVKILNGSGVQDVTDAIYERRMNQVIYESYIEKNEINQNNFKIFLGIDKDMLI